MTTSSICSAAAPLVSELLAKCELLRVLATSRAALRLQPERRFPVEPLALPTGDEPAAVEASAAGALFVERAESHGAELALDPAQAGAVARLCRRLDGLPLAIELAAARAPLFEPSELSARLAHALDALGTGARDAPARQRTLGATLDWSYRLLSAAEAQAFCRFAVFAGGTTIDGAEHVAGAGPDTLRDSSRTICSSSAQAGSDVGDGARGSTSALRRPAPGRRGP